jgi:hypothetical protein
MTPVTVEKEYKSDSEKSVNKGVKRVYKEKKRKSHTTAGAYPPFVHPVNNIRNKSQVEQVVQGTHTHELAKGRKKNKISIQGNYDDVSDKENHLQFAPHILRVLVRAKKSDQALY